MWFYFFAFVFFKIMCMSALPTRLCVHHLRRQFPLEFKLQIVVSHHVSAPIRTRVLCKSKCSKPPYHLSSFWVSQFVLPFPGVRWAAPSTASSLGREAGRGELASASCWPSGSSTRERPGTTRCGCALSGRERLSANSRSKNGNGSDVTLASSAPSGTDHPSFAGSGRKRKLLRGRGELPEECQVTLPILSDFQPRPTEQVKRGSEG